jgi:hypothetical protein
VSGPGLLGVARGINATVLRPFRQRVDLLTAGLLLVLLLALAGQWHLIIETVEA